MITRMRRARKLLHDEHVTIAHNISDHLIEIVAGRRMQHEMLQVHVPKQETEFPAVLSDPILCVLRITPDQKHTRTRHALQCNLRFRLWFAHSASSSPPPGGVYV